MSEFLDRLKGRMQDPSQGPGGLGLTTPRPKPKPKTLQNLVTSRWDKRVWQEARQTEAINHDVQDLYVGELSEKEGRRKGYDFAPELVQDLFASFYKAAPRFEEKRNVQKDARLNRAILEEVHASPDYLKLHNLTAMDPVMSTMATTAITDAVREILVRRQQQEPEGPWYDGEGPRPPVGPKPPGGDGNPPPGPPPGPPGTPRGPDGREGGPGGPPGPPDPDDWGQNPPSGDGDDQGDDDDFEPDDERDLTGGESPDFDPNAEHDDEEHEAGGGDGFDHDDIDRLMARALRDAAKDLGDLDHLRRGIGLEDGEWQTMPPEKRWVIAERLRTPQMKALSDIVGRMKHFALGLQAEKILNAPHEIYGVENGDRFQHLLRSEMALLATPQTEPIFYQKFVDKELLQYQMRGREEAGKGPIVIAIDKSGSMDGAPFNWAMAVGEALRQICAEQDRDYYAMLFGTNDDRHRFNFPKGKADFDYVLKFLSCRANSGTEFTGVLTEGLQRCQEGEGKSDLVFITDGLAHLSDEWIEEFNTARKEAGVRVYSVFIGGARDYYDRPSSAVQLLDRISDAVIPVSDLKPEAVREIFAKV